LAGDTSIVAVVMLVGRHGIGSDPSHLPKVGLGGGVRSCANSSSLNLGPLDLVGQSWLATKEVLMVVAVLVSSTSEALEAIQVQLPLEGTHLAELEISGEELFEFLGLANDKASSMGLPRDHVAVSIGFHFVQHLVKADGEGCGHSTSCWTVFNTFIFIGMVVVVVLHDDVRMMFATCAAAGRLLWYMALDGCGLNIGAKGTGVDGLHVVVSWSAHCLVLVFVK